MRHRVLADNRKRGFLNFGIKNTDRYARVATLIYIFFLPCFEKVSFLRPRSENIIFYAQQRVKII